jgi:phosphoribosyl 1,2-cyclic phosphodiesterase
MKIKYYGVRGSIPTPLVPEMVMKKSINFLKQVLNHKNHKGLTLKEIVRKIPFHLRSTYGGNTPCLYIRIKNEHLIFDAGSGIRELGLDLMKEEFGQGKGRARIFFSHTHWDHIQGFPFFIPFFIPGNQFEFYSCFPDIEDRLRKQLDSQHFPISMDYMQSNKKFFTLEVEKPRSFGTFTINTMKQNHPGDSFAYRVEEDGKTFVYSTDVEYNDKNYEQLHKAIEFFKDADVLTFDTQYTLMEALDKTDWGHSSAQMGIDIAHNSNIKKVVLFHYDPSNSDEKIAEMVEVGISYKNKLYPDSDIQIIPAYEGLVINI